MNEERFQLLVEKALEGRIADHEARELLEAPDPFRGRLFDEMLMAGLLARAHRAAPEDLALQVQAALRGKSDKDAMVTRVLGNLPSRRSGFRPFLAIAAAALVAAALVAVFSRVPTDRPRPIGRAAGAPPVELAPEARTAVARGVEFLHRAKLPSCGWQAPLPSDELVLLVFLQAGVSQDDTLLQQLLRRALSAKLQRTYSVSLQAMLLEKLDRTAYRDRLVECAQFLVDNQCVNGQWSYGEPTLAPRGTVVKKTRDGPLSGNNSCSQFAAFGLRACVDAGISVPAETFNRASRAWRDCQRPDGDDRAGWCYTREETPHRPYGSMTAGGLAALVICDRLAGRDWRLDRAARSGLGWLNYHFTAIENYGPVEELMAKEMISDTPNPNTELYFYLWAVERAGAVCGQVLFGTQDWYAEGSREILAAQRPDGSWSSGVKRCQPAWDTCFAILFLTRSTRPLGD